MVRSHYDDLSQGSVRLGQPAFLILRRRPKAAFCPLSHKGRGDHSCLAYGSLAQASLRFGQPVLFLT